MTPPVLDPPLLAERAVAAPKPLLADAFAGPGVSGAVFSLRPDVALAPLPGLAPAVPDLGMKGFTAAPTLGLTLPGFDMIDTDLAAPSKLTNSSAIDLLIPRGVPIGSPGSRDSIREMSGGEAAAKKLLQELVKDATNVTPPGYNGELYALPEGVLLGTGVLQKADRQQ